MFRNSSKTAYAAAYLALIASVLWALGCSSDNNDGSDDSYQSPTAETRVVRTVSSASVEGTDDIALAFSLDRTVSALQLVARCDRCTLSFASVETSGGVPLFRADDALTKGLTDAGTSQSKVAAINFPFVPWDGPILKGSYTARIRVRAGGQDETVTLGMVTKDIESETAGVVDVNVVYAGPIATDEDLLDGIEDSLDTALDLLGRQGLKVNLFRHYVPELDGQLPDPFRGDPLYEEFGLQLNDGIPLYFGVSVPLNTMYADVSASAAISPGPLFATQRSAIVVDMSEAAGPDGELNGKGVNDATGAVKDQNRGDEKRLLAESIAYALLRYLGLRDLVTFRGSEVVETDGLSSPSCLNEAACEDNKDVRRNLLYPYPVEHFNTGGDREFFERDTLVNQQKQLLLREPGVG